MGHHRWVLKFVVREEELESWWDSDPSDNKIETIKLEFGNIIWVLVNLKVES